jgi:predicted nucleic acid-binding protein
MQVASIDTNVFLRLMLDDIPDQHEKAKRLIMTPGCRFVIDEAAVIECVYALSEHYSWPRAAIRDVVSATLQLEPIISSKWLLEQTLEFYAQHPKLSFQDCFLAERAQQNRHTPLWTFDHKLASQHSAVKLL